MDLIDEPVLDVGSQLVQLAPDLHALIASYLEDSLDPSNWNRQSLRNLGQTCKGLKCLAERATILDVSCEVFEDNDVAREFQARFKDLRYLRINIAKDHVLPFPSLDFTMLTSRLQMLHVDNRRMEQVIITPQACRVFAGLKELRGVNMINCRIMDVLNFPPSVTDVAFSSLSRKNDRITVTGTGILKYKTTCVVHSDIDLRGMPAVQDLSTAYSEATGVHLTVPSKLRILDSGLVPITAGVLSKLMDLRSLRCATHSKIVDLRACVHLETLYVVSATMSSLDVSDCVHLVSFTTRVGHRYYTPSSLIHLDFRGCVRLTTCNLHKCSLVRQPFESDTHWRLLTLDLSCCDYLSDVAGLPSSLVTLKLDRCKRLLSFSGLILPDLETLDVSCCRHLSVLDLSGCTSPNLKVNREGCSKLDRSLCEDSRCPATYLNWKSRVMICRKVSSPDTGFCESYHQSYFL